MELQQDIQELAAQLGRILTDKALWITTAESCTGGGISYALTDTPGSSAYLDRAFITYSNKAKRELLNVSNETLLEYGAVSKQTVDEMAKGACLVANADVAITVSGIAGPGGATETKPVGTVWFCIRYLNESHTYGEVFIGGRAEIRLQAIVFALKKLIVHIN
ncbi:CinA family protein [Pseudoalteromonas denitrificans]|jgi:nicotinamide-nucleotide amidase|uniref:Nicotinamide-nucleotide amidase n=1 Tax=Pseudoalteromonas denitrificans DSM 6059 TaxID=1123010 RepID=A0A1I1E5H9_9GAMM|nr:nicotinamide-nucleotide amidohydrolase family protein [Pseudoalteromonas denitrificans]SFB82499.1 nicotinamide-nucleotide amidase [Pseudoalteromonas denitrificans DSM 6059]